MKAYIARDKDGGLYLYKGRPNRHQSVWSSSLWGGMHISNSDLPEGINPQREDDEPIKVELTIERI